MPLSVRAETSGDGFKRRSRPGNHLQPHKTNDPSRIGRNEQRISMNRRRTCRPTQTGPTARTCLMSPSKACSIKTRLASVVIIILCPSALNFMFVHLACDSMSAFCCRTSGFWQMNSATYKKTRGRGSGVPVRHTKRVASRVQKTEPITATFASERQRSVPEIFSPAT